MPQFSPLWFINTISWCFALVSFTVFMTQSILFPALIRVQLSRLILSLSADSNSI